jgi:hypothetical protein
MDRPRNQNLLMRRFLLPQLIATVTILFVLPAFAKEKECCWIDAKTGKPVGSVPADALIRDENGHAEVHSSDDFSKTAFNRRTKQNYVKDDDGCWVDATGRNYTGSRVNKR